MNSKALEAFDYITTFSVKGEKVCIQDVAKYQANCDIVENALKALEIIKEKEVNVQDFKICLENKWDYELFERFCQDNAPFAEDVAYVHPMTVEEFDLLKEVLL